MNEFHVIFYEFCNFPFKTYFCAFLRNSRSKEKRISKKNTNSLYPCSSARHQLCLCVFLLRRTQVFNIYFRIRYINFVLTSWMLMLQVKIGCFFFFFFVLIKTVCFSVNVYRRNDFSQQMLKCLIIAIYSNQAVAKPRNGVFVCANQVEAIRVTLMNFSLACR